MNTCDHYKYVKTKAYVHGKLKKPVRRHVLAILTAYLKTRFKVFSLVLKRLDKEDFKDFEAMTEKTDFFTW